MKSKALLPLIALLLGASPFLRADGPAPRLADGWTPPTAEVIAANGLLPRDRAMDHKKHNLLDRWTRMFGLTEEQRCWIEPQLHAEEGLSKPVLAYRALTDGERKQILLIIKLAARRQVLVLLTPAQQVLMKREIESTKAAGR